MNILENNKLIAEFMGCVLKSYPTAMKSPFHGRDVWWSDTSSNGKTRGFHCIKGEEHYHDSWDWLMPVVEKIESLNPSGDRWIVQIEGISCRIYSIDISIEFEKCTSLKLNSTYRVIVEFLEWLIQRKITTE